MSDPYIGEIRAFGFNFAPVGWAFCDGALLSIADNSALFALIGTTFGGDGITTFGLPDLRGRFPIHRGQVTGLSAYTIGEMAGSETVTVTGNQIPAHTHVPLAVAGPGLSAAQTPAANLWASQASTTDPPYVNVAPSVDMKATQGTGGSQPHNNMPPYQVVNFCIALAGVFPTRN